MKKVRCNKHLATLEHTLKCWVQFVAESCGILGDGMSKKDDFYKIEDNKIMPTVVMESPLIKSLKKATETIISYNPCKVQVMRDVPIYDDENEEVVDIDRQLVSNEVVRLSQSSKEFLQTLKINNAHLHYSVCYHLTAYAEANINKGDVLIREDGEMFSVDYITTLYMEGFALGNAYRKTGVAVKSVR
mgnify:CR=1 FL=1